MTKRRYISLDIDIFFNLLNSSNIRYVVLRWFETLPNIEAGEDIDLLVHDEDLDKLGSFLSVTPQKNAIPCDVYSIYGKKGYDYENMPYYPKHIGTSIIQNRVLFKEKYYVPNQRDHFFSMAYHAIYHKTTKSGLPKSNGKQPVVKKPKHDYKDVLTKLSKAISIDVDMTWDDLHLLLISNTWCPTIEMIKKLSIRRKWLRTLYQSVIKPLDGGDLISFILRDAGYEKNLLNFAIDWLESYGFTIIEVEVLSEHQKEIAKKKIRGGCWERGSWIKNGGGPAVLLVAYDPHPTKVPSIWKKRYPLVSNGRLLFKKKLRKTLNKQLPRTERANMIHSSDHPFEAMEYIKVICPDKISGISEKITNFIEKYQTNEKIIKMYHGRNGIGPFTNHDHQRGKTELIEKEGKPFIKKTFKPKRERFLEREKFAFKTLSQKCSLIPPLVDCDNNYVIIPYYNKLLPKKALFIKHRKEIRAFLTFLYEEGYAHLDFLPRNILFTTGGVKIIDFEFLYQYKIRPTTFYKSYDMASVPKDFEGDLPPMGIHSKGITAYNHAWRKACGYSLLELIELE